MKVFIYPEYKGEDQGDGGIRRVVEAQVKHLPTFGITIVDSPEEADLIACHIQIPTSFLARWPEKAYVEHCHGLYWSGYEWGGWQNKVNGEVMASIRAADAVTGPSEWVSATLRRHTSRDVISIVHGVDSAEWQTEAPPAGYVLWNKTRVDPICDPSSVNLVAAMMPDVPFVTTFGDEAPNVHVTGKVPYADAKTFVQKASVYLATTKETFGIGTLEAMAAGVPVVGYRFGGQPEIVREGKDGYLVAPGDIGGLVRAISFVLQNRDELSANARERAAEFTWERAAKAYADLYKKTLKERQQKRPRTTIIVTNYNLHEYLGECLKSIHDQTDKDWECIVVDDASPNPQGKALANAFAESDKRFRVIENPSNVYLAEARNIGIREAKGKYILPLDADDYLEPSAVGLLANALDKDRNIHIAYGNVKFVDVDGTPTVYRGFEQNPGFSSWPVEFDLTKQLKEQNLLPYASMYRRSVWQGIGGYSPRCRTAEDATFWTRASSYGFTPKMVTEAPTLVYRNRPGSMSREQPPVHWIVWFPWAHTASLIPAGATLPEQSPVSALDELWVSVVIPVGPNHTLLVKDAVESVDAQFYRDWECIVVNDSGQKLPELPAWVRVIETGKKTPIGVAAARNLGIAASRAPLFLPLDADDLLQPRALSLMVEAFKATKDIIYSDMYEDPETPGSYKVFSFRDFDATNLTRGTLHTVTALTPRAVWRDVGGYDENLPAWEDWDFQLKCADKGYCSRRVAQPLFIYRKHTGIRRNQNLSNFEVSKRGILSKWARLWEGEKLMACSCGVRPAYKSVAQATVQSGNGAQSAQLVEYTGNKSGNVPYRGYDGTYYTFAAGESKLVLTSDLPIFAGRPDFRVVPQGEASLPGAPVLVA